ncbi:nuclear transport factor 2 family protein [Psychroserpens sp. AS72]|uniref:nuclear transport factor 2 family protein n=1 Tax=Psychroserpens sp. AS72 TaxID=3135775 RepID=UPI00317A9265
MKKGCNSIEMDDMYVVNEDITKVSERIVTHYLNALYENDIDAMMSNYTNKSILITLVKTYKGLKEIREFMSELAKHFSHDNTVLILDKMIFENEVAYIVWHAHSPIFSISMASETFFIKEEKIIKHTFIGQLSNDSFVV